MYLLNSGEPFGKNKNLRDGMFQKKYLRRLFGIRMNVIEKNKYNETVASPFPFMTKIKSDCIRPIKLLISAFDH